jgi:hypothetical protein
VGCGVVDLTELSPATDLWLGRLFPGAVMGGIRAGGRKSAVVTVAAAAALLLGLVFVAAAATRASTSPHATATSEVPPHVGSHSAPPAMEATVPPTMAITIPPATEPVVLSPAPTTSAASPTTNPASPTTNNPPTSVALAPVVAPAVTPALTRAPQAGRTAGPAVAGLALTAAAQTALGLIAAISLQGNGRDPIPATQNNVGLLERWMANEGGLWADNPLNTSLEAASYPHQFTTSGQDSGIPIFPNLTSGITATATTLLSNPAYARVLRVLRSGSASCIAFARSVIQSPWASGHYGHDPTGFCSGRIVPNRRGHRHHH